jgi:NDP-sugar pyrophosphorylase family protein
MAVYSTKSLSSGARVVTAPNGRVLDVVESTGEGTMGLVNTGLYGLDTRVFDFALAPKAPGSKEYGLPQTLLNASIPLYSIVTNYWVQITKPDDLIEAERLLAAGDGA